MYIKFQFLGSGAISQVRNVLGRYNLACLFLFKALMQIVNIVSLEGIKTSRYDDNSILVIELSRALLSTCLTF